MIELDYAVIGFLPTHYEMFGTHDQRECTPWYLRYMQLVVDCWTKGHRVPIAFFDLMYNIFVAKVRLDGETWLHWYQRLLESILTLNYPSSFVKSGSVVLILSPDLQRKFVPFKLGRPEVTGRHQQSGPDLVATFFAIRSFAERSTTHASGIRHSPAYACVGPANNHHDQRTYGDLLSGGLACDGDRRFFGCIHSGGPGTCIAASDVRLWAAVMAEPSTKRFIGNRHIKVDDKTKAATEHFQKYDWCQEDIWRYLSTHWNAYEARKVQLEGWKEVLKRWKARKSLPSWHRQKIPDVPTLADGVDEDLVEQQIV